MQKRINMVKNILAIMIIACVIYIFAYGTPHIKYYALYGNDLLVSLGSDKVHIYTMDKKKLDDYEVGGDKEEIMSYDFKDVDKDGKTDILLLLKNNNEEYGSLVKIYSFDEGLKEICSMDFSDYKPWKIQGCDVDDDGIVEVSVGVFKKTQFHQIEAKRPFIFNFGRGKLTPKWRGSRLSKPFDDYIFVDIDYDMKDEIAAIEYLENGMKVINTYDWNGFGFDAKLQSKPFEDIYMIKRLDDNRFVVNVKIGDEKEVLYITYGEDGKFIYEKEQ